MLTIFEKPGCPHCKRARDHLRKKKIAFTTVRCKDVDELKEKIREKGFGFPQRSRSLGCSTARNS